MPELRLRFQSLDKEAEFDVPVPVSVHFENSDTEIFPFVNPLTDKDLAELRWYLEEYTRWPSDIDDDRAHQVEGHLPRWGKALFDAVFRQGTEPSADAMRLFERFSQSEGARVLTIDTVEPRILRLPWEILRDEGGYLFSEGVSLRRRLHKVRRQNVQPFDLPVRILMVTCRPDGAGFIDPRSIAAPLLDALAGLPGQVEVEFLRPPTLRALDERLRDETRPRVHIVHFDGHGVYDREVGLGFLLFEDDEHRPDRVDAERLGTLLNDCGVPLMVLNACQSAQPDERNPFASVAARLIEAGVGGVVAMNYSVLVETARRFTRAFYGALARGRSVSAAMDEARRDLLRDTKRLTLRRPHAEEPLIVHLQDWFLPALYQQADELVPFRASSPVPAAPESERREERLRGDFPPPPLHGFHGRARELLLLERAFASRPIVILHGFGGQGKTALAAQAADWFMRTRRFERAVFLSFEHGLPFESVLHELGNALVGENFQIYPGEKVEALARSLREHPALVIFDNFESVLPNGNAPLPAEELQSLLDAAARCFPPPPPDPRSRHAGSCLLITSRNPDLPHPAFAPGRACQRMELEGLAPDDALDLAAAILEAHSLPRPPRRALQELLDFLKGHPLSLQLALPHLRHFSPETLVAEYQQILPRLKTGAGQERNESLEVSLRFSLDRLGEEARAWLSRLWMFEGGAWEPVLLDVTEIPAETWNALKPQLTSTALIRLEEIPGVTVPFIHFHPTLAPFLRANAPLPMGEGAGGEGQIETRYWQAYYALATQLYHDDTQHPAEARALVRRELPNLQRALGRALEAGALDEAVEFAEIISKFLNNFGRWREREELAEEVYSYTIRQVDREGKVTQREVLLESGRGERLYQQGRAAEAEQVFRALLKRLEGPADYDTRYDRANLLGYIGRSLSAQGKKSSAAEFHRKAIEAWSEMEQIENILRSKGIDHTDLADVLTDMGQYAEARSEYEKGLEIAKEVEDDRQQGAILGQLGTLALVQGDLNEARRRHQEALTLFQRLGEARMEAVAWHQLGRVAQEQAGRAGAQQAAPFWEEAERCYKESAEIEERLGNLAGLAKTCNQLAIVATGAGRPQEAERWSLRAIEIGEKLGDLQGLATRFGTSPPSTSPKTAWMPPKTTPAAPWKSKKRSTFHPSRGQPTPSSPKSPPSVGGWTRPAPGAARSRSPLPRLRGVTWLQTYNILNR